ncbi:sensor domain-containing diguanylate cyclase [Xiamenia xianingshaonis]|uniref:Diguanylate cyclase n=1 Tax=Xiamenia xianingshaonis TaxID=2682776 RepID=A0ABX0IPA9_9ACTN|nr:sensor domain-containing diguanylate cyclase [Xiamenia xianingshaonis]NHM14741.1 diguanylate cyclase [Xiamenia xianingshaonis]
MEKKAKISNVGFRLICSVMLIVLPLLIMLFMLVRQEVLDLSREKLAIQSQSGAEAVGVWAEEILDELDIYKDMIEQVGMDNPEVFKLMGTSYPDHETYPYGLYWGDKEKNYFDSSGWVPEEDYVPAERNWYREGLTRDRFGFGEPYVDVMTGDICVSASARVNNSPVESVVAADVYLDYASKVVADVTDIAGGDIGYAFFVTGKSRIILADSSDSMEGQPLNSEENILLYQNVDRLIAENRTGQQEVEGTDGHYITNIIHIDAVDWYFVTCMDSSVALRNLYRILAIMAVASLVACLLLVLVTFYSAKQIALMGIREKTDNLTGLLNRSGFHQAVKRALTAHPGQGVLIIMDLDNFKQINDKFGHPEGDVALRSFARQLDEFFNRSGDITARLGGDEFAVFVGRPLAADAAKGMLRKFIDRVRETFETEYPGEGLSVSAGASFVPKNPEKAMNDELYRQTDAALYEAKRNGRDGFVFANEAPEEE